MKALQDYFQEILMDSSSSSLVLVHDNAISHYHHHHYYCCCKLCNPSCCSSTTSSNLSSSSFHGSRHTPQDWLMETTKNIPNGDDSSCCSSRNHVYTNLPSFVLSPKRNDSPSSNGRNHNMDHEKTMVGMMRKPKRLVSFPLSHQNCRGAGGGGAPFFPHNNNESPFSSPTKTSTGDGNGACPTTRSTLSSSLSLSTSSSSSCNVNHQEDNNRRLTMSGYYDCGIHNNHSKIMNNTNNTNKDTRWSPILPLKESLLFHPHPHHHSKEADSSSSPPISPKRRRSLETILDEVLVLGEMM